MRYYPVSKANMLETVVQYTETCIELPYSLITHGAYFYDLQYQESGSIEGYDLPFQRSTYDVIKRENDYIIKFRVTAWQCPS